MTGQEVSQNEVLLGSTEQTEVRCTLAGSGLVQDSETKSLMGPGQGFGRGATDPGGDAFTQISGRRPRCRQHQALVWRDPVTSDQVDHDLDSG
jgi:hypothetical protein